MKPQCMAAPPGWAAVFHTQAGAVRLPVVFWMYFPEHEDEYSSCEESFEGIVAEQPTKFTRVSDVDMVFLGYEEKASYGFLGI